MRAYAIFSAVLAVAMFVAPVLVLAQTARTPAEAAHYRDQQFRRLAATQRNLANGLRVAAPDYAQLHTEAQTLAALAQDLPNWFPAGSVITPDDSDYRARAEVWANAATFQVQVQSFQAATQALAAAPDVDAIRRQQPMVTAACARCHRDFRVEN